MRKERWERIKREVKKNKSIAFALGFLVLIILLAAAASFLPIHPNKLDVDNVLKMPSKDHIFGTDEVGRDYFIRCLYGARVSLFVGLFAMLAALGVGTATGLVAGYYGGLVDELLMRFIDLLSAIPSMILITVIGMFLSPGLFSIILIIGMFSWMEIARIVRAEIISCKEREYIRYAEFFGESTGRIFRKHIIPAIVPTLISAATIGIAGAIMAESALSFLGLGVQAPTSTWGTLLSSAQGNFQKAPHMAFIPGLLIFLTVYSFKKLGILLKLYFQPKLK